jgi:hypothetical protein
LFNYHEKKIKELSKQLSKLYSGLSTKGLAVSENGNNNVDESKDYDGND